MKRFYLCLLALTLLAGTALAQSNVDAGWKAFIIRNGATGSPDIQNAPAGAVEIATWEGSQKAALATNTLNGALVSQISRLHIDRLDDVPNSGSLYGPYFNIWVTDGLGHYAVIANEPSNAEWAGSRWDVASWDFLKTKTCKLFETPGLVNGTPGTSWVAAAIGWTSGAITFEDVGSLIISPPPPAYIANPANGVGGGAPDELVTNIAYGYNWIFGDTMANYVTGSDGFIVDNYFASLMVTNVTQSTTHATIQAAVDAADPGDVISVPGGTYVEQVHIALNNLQVQGAGSGSTYVRSPATLPLFYMTGTNFNRPILFIDGATGVQISGMTVDGNGKGNANYRFQGVGFWNAGGSLSNSAVINVMDTPFSGSQHGVGIYAYNNTNGPYTVAVSNVVVDKFQKNAFALSGVGLTVDLDNITITGAGPTTVTAQNGIQISYGAGGTVDNCVMSGIDYTPGTAASVGLLLYQGTIVTAHNVDVATTQSSIYCQDTSALIDGSDVTSPTGDALYAYSTGAKNNGAPRLPAQPMDADLAPGANKAAISVTVSNGTFIGTGLAGSWGPSAFGTGPITFNVTNCEVANWDSGIFLRNDGGATFNTTISQCNIHDNVSYGFSSNALQTATATCNWWGSTSGPDATGNPSPGDALTGNAVYAPWLDGAHGACVLNSSNTVSVGNAAVCLTPANTCVTVPVTFNRLDTTESRGVSVTIQLSPELVLCTGVPATDIAMATGVGSWSTPFTNLVREIVDNGGGSYTIDRAILGDPCGSDHGGTLFTVNVKKAPAVTTDVIGTVSVTAVTVRDCDNAQLAGIPGAPGQVSINLSIPGVLTSLAAAQVKSGNDTDGTTQIKLQWTAPGGDAALIDLWRKGFGDYPEYNDGSGVVPTAPVTAINGWTHVAQVAATTTMYLDEPATRDFWYYAAFVTDACGNVSAASALTGGTLNYHLGDVVATDNFVTTSDISYLGAHYGIALTPYGDTYNALDVGPTTNYSVNARPTTDNRVQFEDLMMFTINYETVSKIEPHATPAASNAIALVSEAPGAVGSTFDVAVRLSGDGKVQGLSVPLTWNAAAVTPVGMRAGDLLKNYGEQAMVLSPEAGTVDAALVGAREQGIAGEGVLATVTFRIMSVGDPGIGLGTVTARDKDNQPVVLDGADSSLPPASLPSVSELRANVPNPFNPSTEFSFVLAQSGPVTLRVYTVRGELVRTLLDLDIAAGPHTLIWNGMDDQGRQVASGGYIVRFVAPDRTQTRNITLLK